VWGRALPAVLCCACCEGVQAASVGPFMSAAPAVPCWALPAVPAVPAGACRHAVVWCAVPCYVCSGSACLPIMLASRLADPFRARIAVPGCFACRRGAGATPHLVLTHYREMADKGVVLVRGDILQPNVVSRGEVRWCRWGVPGGW
jgi:hypothetical protein